MDDLSVHAQMAVIPNEVRNLIREQNSLSSPTPRNDTKDSANLFDTTLGRFKGGTI
jgi:hypothetical protein